MIMLSLLLAAQASGAVAKFEAKPPVADYESPVKMEAIERCLIRMDAGAPPLVYKQADRPDDAMFVWMKVGEFYGIPGARLDLHRTTTGTHVRSWMPAKQVAECAPIAG